jgi:hypothetical protein
MADQTLYRLVRTYPNFDLNRRASVFHIPFESRHFASAVRYSVKGQPSLYLGNSLYLCWLECDNPSNLSDWYAARFDLDFERLKILDLSASTELLKFIFETSVIIPATGKDIDPGKVTNSPTGENWLEYLAASLTIWPLVAACSISAAHSNDAVKPEYVIPQLTMKWVQQSHDIDGIRFFSTREQAIRSTQDISINYALLAKETEKREGYDQFLVEVAHCTYPISVSEFQNRDLVPPNEAEYETAEKNWRRLTIPEEHGGCRYFGTWYCNLEYELDRREIGRVETDSGRGSAVVA